MSFETENVKKTVINLKNTYAKLNDIEWRPVLVWEDEYISNEMKGIRSQDIVVPKHIHDIN